MNYSLSPTAVAEFRLIVARLGNANPAAGRKFLAAVPTTAQLLASFPLSGAEYPHTNPTLGEVRIVPVRGFRSYVLLYKVESAEVVILHVAHGRQDLDALLSRD